MAQAGDALPDLNLTCITKPFMNGLQMMKIIRNNPLWKTIPIIVVSAAVGKQEIASQAWELGAKAVIEKPFEADAVLDSVAKWVNSS